MFRSDDRGADELALHESTANVLLAEDDPAYARLIEEAFGAVDLPTNLHVVTDGSAALAFARRSAEDADAPRPDLVLLDWHLPGVSGSGVLEAFAESEEHRKTPVVVLTNSDDRRHVRRAYELNANAFVTKPDDLDALMDTIESIARFWL